MAQKPKTRLFLSHSSKDKSFVGKLAQRLTADGYSVWYDDWELLVGDSIVRKIEEGITSSDFLIVLLSRHSVKSKWVREELNAATMKGIEQNGPFVLPVLLERCDIPPFLAHRKYADFSKEENKGYRELIRAIEGRRKGVIIPKAESNLVTDGLTVVHNINDLGGLGLPVISCTLMNRSDSSQVIAKLEVCVLKYNPRRSPPRNRFSVYRDDVKAWDIDLPRKSGTKTYTPFEPIYIQTDQPSTIRLRLFCSYYGTLVPPTERAAYTLKFIFISDQGMRASTDAINL